MAIPPGWAVAASIREKSIQRARFPWVLAATPIGLLELASLAASDRPWLSIRVQSADAWEMRTESPAYPPPAVPPCSKTSFPQAVNTPRQSMR